MIIEVPKTEKYEFHFDIKIRMPEGPIMPCHYAAS
jgi:hypothetical protein